MAHLKPCDTHREDVNITVTTSLIDSKVFYQQLVYHSLESASPTTVCSSWVWTAFQVSADKGSFTTPTTLWASQAFIPTQNNVPVIP